MHVALHTGLALGTHHPPAVRADGEYRKEPMERSMAQQSMCVQACRACLPVCLPVTPLENTQLY